MRSDRQPWWGSWSVQDGIGSRHWGSTLPLPSGWTTCARSTTRGSPARAEERMNEHDSAGTGGRHRSAPRAVIVVRHDGREYWRNLDRCRVLLLQRQIEGINTGAAFARLAGVSTSTLYRWMRGETPGSEETTRRIL